MFVNKSSVKWLCHQSTEVPSGQTSLPFNYIFSLGICIASSLQITEHSVKTITAQIKEFGACTALIDDSSSLNVH